MQGQIENNEAKMWQNDKNATRIIDESRIVSVLILGAGLLEQMVSKLSPPPYKSNKWIVTIFLICSIICQQDPQIKIVIYWS